MVGPGDVLYIPPMWGHYVVALTPSISLNVWTQGEDSAAKDRIGNLRAVMKPQYDVFPFKLKKWGGGVSGRFPLQFTSCNEALKRIACLIPT